MYVSVWGNKMKIKRERLEGARGGEGVAREAGRRGGAEVVKPQIFDGISSRVAEFITACKLYIRIKMREEPVERQIQWILSYM